MILRPHIRHQVFRRDGYRCTECGSTERLVVHHKWPQRKGGSESLKNLSTVCDPCHRKKHAFIDIIRRRWKKYQETDEIGTRVYEYEVH